MMDDEQHFDNTIANWWTWFEAACQRDGVLIDPSSPWRDSAEKVWLASEFVRQRCTETPCMLADLVASGDLYRVFSKMDFSYLYKQCLKSVSSMADLKQVARQFRTLMMVRIIWRDVAGWAGLRDVIKETSDCADVMIDLTNKLLYRWLSKKRSAPPLIDRRPPHMIIIAVGKLGGMELNLSSDVDLLFCYMSPTVSTCDHDEVRTFYQSIAQQLIDVLADVNRDGFVYRVDLRLRPYGTSGALVVSSSAMAHYYKEHAREWERYAMLKARVISADPRQAKQIMQALESFVYRPYLDYSTVESLRQLHQLWSLEAKRKQLHDNIKMGVGGIREIEFIVQNIQLTRGGQEPRLRQQNLLATLSVIEQEKLLPAAIVVDLERYYVFFRMVENRLQGFLDHQTHSLPRDNAKRYRLAVTMGYADWDSMHDVLIDYRDKTHQYFRQLIFRPEAYEYSNHELDFQKCLGRCWLGQVNRQMCEQYVESIGYDDPVRVTDLLLAFKKLAAVQSPQSSIHTDCLKLLSMVLAKVCRVDQSDQTIKRVLSVLMVVSDRRAYLVLLLENLSAVDHLVRLCFACPWVADQMCVYPSLVGELVDDDRLFEPMSLTSLKRKLLRWLRPVLSADESEQMRVIAHFKLCHLFKVAAMDVSGRLPIAHVSNYLSYIAEVVLQHVTRLAWRQIRSTEGAKQLIRRHPRCIIVAYGKLGGLELGYGSDLDLVFLYRESDRYPDDVAVPESTLYTKLVQKILALMRFQTVTGPLYCVDTRLRPSGESGLLVNRLETFKAYQLNEAWVWEHQALVRARVVVGPADMRSGFYGIRKEVLSTPRDAAALWETVSQMRQKMFQAATLPDASMIHLKQSKGCLSDIEFIVQYLVLSSAASYPSLVSFTDNIRLLEIIGRMGLISGPEARLLYDAFLAYRSTIHRLDLQKISSHNVSASKFKAYRAAVQRIWEKLSTAKVRGQDHVKPISG